jgi:hypothetical protein
MTAPAPAAPFLRKVLDFAAYGIAILAVPASGYLLMASAYNEWFFRYDPSAIGPGRSFLDYAFDLFGDLLSWRAYAILAGSLIASVLAYSLTRRRDAGRLALAATRMAKLGFTLEMVAAAVLVWRVCVRFVR